MLARSNERDGDLRMPHDRLRNAANEEAVAAFLSGTIRFDRIHKVNARTMAAVIPQPGAADSLDALLALDAEARRHAVRFLKSLVDA